MNQQTSTFDFHPRRRGRRVAHALSCAAMLAVSLLFATQAFASTSGETVWMTFPHLEVASNGHEYTGVGPIASGWQARIVIETGAVGRVKSWDVYPTLRAADGSELDFRFHNASQYYPFSNRPKSVDRTVGRIFPNAYVSDFAAAACNHNLSQLMSQGSTRAQVLGQDRTIEVALGSYLTFEVTVGDTFSEIFSESLEITCEKSPFEPLPPGPGGMASGGEFKVDNASLVVYPTNYSGPCPKELTLFMDVQGTMKGTFEARIESTAGWKSTPFVLQTNEFHGASGLWGREFNEAFSVPVDMPTGGGSGGGLQPASGDLQAPTGTGGDGPVIGPGGPKPVGGLTAEDPGSNVHQQSLRLAATADGKTVYSQWRQYRVVCDPKPAVEPATTSLLPGGNGPGKPGDDGPKPGAEPAPAPASGRSEPAEPAKTKASSKPEKGGKPADGLVEGRADLRVVRARRSAEDATAIEFEVENAGKGASKKAMAKLTCATPAGGAQTWSAALPGLPAGGRRWVESSPTRPKSAGGRVRGCDIEVDSTAVVAESNEGNNRYSCADCGPASPSKRR